MARNTALRDKHRRIIARGKPPCHICGQPIDYQAHHLDPHSYTVDHITPLTRGGPDTLDNCAAAHRKCNRDKSDHQPGKPGTVYITERAW
jgi:5-methylcytosine-specific restriction endonuclease McrA